MAHRFEWKAPRWRRRTGIRPAERRARRRRQRGAALLLVVWIFIVLFVVVLDFASSMRDDGLATANLADETQVYFIALAGLNRAIYDVLRQLEENPNALDVGEDQEGDDDDEVGLPGDEELGEAEDGICGEVMADGQWYECDFGGGSYSVRLLDESSKLGLNVLAREENTPLLRRIVERLLIGGNATEGVSVAEDREISTIVDSILDWYDNEGEEDEITHPNGAEADYYAGLPQPYPIKNGRFDSLEELLLVRGVTPELFYGVDGQPGLRDIFSVDSTTKYINVLQAPAAVLRVLLNIDEEEAQALVAEREEQSFGFVERVRGMAMAVGPDGSVIAELFRGKPSTKMTVEARGTMGDRIVAHVAAVVDLKDTFEGPMVLKWFDRVPGDWKGPGDLGDEGA
jgi:general secretion pathway protein K